MSFGEHLEELRRCLLRAIAGLVVGFIVGLFLGGQIVEMVQSPLKRALTAYYQGRTEGVISKNRDEFYQRGYGEDILALPSQYGLVGEKYLINPDELGKALGIEVKDISADLENPCNQIGDGVSISSEDVEERNKKWKFADYFNIEKWAQWISESWSSKGIDLNEDVSQTVLEESAQSDEVKEQTAENTEAVPGTGSDASGAAQTAAAETAVAETAGAQTPEVQTAPAETAAAETAEAQTAAAEKSSEPVKAERKKTRLVSIFLWKRTANDERTQVKNFAVQETFMIYLKAALVAGIIISSPWIFWQIWSFIAAGLYPNEKRYVHIFLPFSLGLFLGGNLLAFFFVFEPVLQYLFSFNEWMGIAPDPRISEWLGFFLLLPVGFGISFQLPLVMLFLNRIGLFEAKVYSRYWRVAVLIIFFISMILTPADPTSMVLMAIPLSALYLGGIILCYVFPRRLNPLAEVK